MRHDSAPRSLLQIILVQTNKIKVAHIANPITVVTRFMREPNIFSLRPTPCPENFPIQFPKSNKMPEDQPTPNYKLQNKSQVKYPSKSIKQKRTNK
uniref:RING-H2 finger protein ATL40-like n=1 Tax=Rhizophora mucronata TaxID=61149 RepID=A0A2P2PYJ5_RHIMU